MKLLNRFAMVGLLLIMALAVSVTATFARIENSTISDVSFVNVYDDDDREVVWVNNTADLLDNIGRDDVEIYLAPQSTDEGGRYVIPACPPEVDEYADPTCGVLIQGNNAVLESSLDLAQDEQGVPYPDAELLIQGAVIDCSELPFGPNQLLASCLIPGDGSVIRKLTIDGSAAGGEPAEMLGFEKRNAITIQGTSSRVEEVVFRNVRRGVLNVSWFLDGASTSASVTSSHFTNIELAATFGFTILSTDHRLDYEIRANYFAHRGLHADPLRMDPRRDV